MTQARHPVHDLPLAALFRAKSGAHSMRSSSWDRSGANADYVRIGPGETCVLLSNDGPGCVRHLYWGIGLYDLPDYRNAILRAYWDGSDRPSIEAPVGDFFGCAHGRVRDIKSTMFCTAEGYGCAPAHNCYFPMPFNAARITLTNRGPHVLGAPIGGTWFHVDYETYDEPIPDGVHRFHASYRQERPTSAQGDRPNVTITGDINITGAENYVALDTTGSGRMVGLVLGIHNLQGPIWYGEGDDMVFIDGETWPPSIHGTGTEEIFGGGACPATEYAGPYTGFHQIESPRWDGTIGMYRWYVHDPIHFSTSIRWTLEHGHANNFANDYSSVAYWYQTPLAVLPELPSEQDMLPPLPVGYDEVRAAAVRVAAAKANASDVTPFINATRPYGAVLRGRTGGVREALEATRS